MTKPSHTSCSSALGNTVDSIGEGLPATFRKETDSNTSETSAEEQFSPSLSIFRTKELARKKEISHFQQEKIHREQITDEGSLEPNTHI